MKARLASITQIAVIACALTLAGCGTMSKMWPFHKRAKAGPQAVEELSLVNSDGSAATYPQYWKRNTLVIDLSGVSGNGAVAAKLRDGTEWPVRVAVRVRPASVQQLEVVGEERNILPVTPEGSKLIDIELAPSVYTPKTAAIYLSWGPMPVFADAPVDTATPGFVSPTQVPTTSPAPAAPPPATEPTSEPGQSASDIIPPGTAPPQSPGN